jgi:two-component system cell cycle response regulator
MAEESGSSSIDDLFASPAGSATPKKSETSGAKTILVAEDDDKIRALVAEVMRREGYQVEEAADGQDALQIATETTIDLVISDLMMPRMNGWRLLSSLRERNNDVPVIILTGHMTEEGEEVLTSKDIVGFLAKPIKFDELRKMVRGVFRAPQAAETKRRILAADDSEDSRILVESCLVKAGFDVKTVDTGAAVLPMVGLFEPDLLILDVVMPDINGFEVCAQLRANAKTAYLPVIMLTAKGSPAYIKKAVSLRVSGYIIKPFTSELLVTRVDRALQGSDYHKSSDG